MVAGAIAGNISAEATTPTGNTFSEATRGLDPRQNNAVVLAATLGKLNLENPLKDLNINLKRGDKRFIGINGYSCDAPGATDADQRIVNSPEFGLHCLDGTSDVVGSDEHFRLMQKATDYATVYNRELLRRIRAGLVKSS